MAATGLRFSAYLADLLADILAGDGTTTSNAGACYCRLHTGDPGTAGTSNLVSGASYADIRANFASTASSGGGIDSNTMAAYYSNTSEISIPNESGSDQTVSWISLWKSTTTTSTNYLARLPLNSSGTVYAGTSLTFPTGTFQFGLQAGASWTFTGFMGVFGFGTTWAQQILEFIMGRTNLTAKTPYLQAHSSWPGASGANQVSMGTRYSLDAVLTSSGGTVTTNASINGWQNTSGSEVTLESVSIYDASSGGNMLVALRVAMHGTYIWKIPDDGYFGIEGSGTSYFRIDFD